MTVDHYRKVTSEAIAELRSKIGKPVSISASPHLTETTRDVIRHWAEGIGDRNRLWTDEAYARSTKWKGLLAPPTILYAFDRQSIGYRGGFPGVHSLFGGTNWTFHRPLHVGERISATVVFKDLVEVEGRFAGRMFKQVSEITFVDENGGLVATAESWGMRTERSTANERGKYNRLEPAVYTSDDIAAITNKYAEEFIRGSGRLWWEDVDLGTTIPSIIRGPYTVTTAIAFEMGWGGLFIHTHGRWFELISKHPNLGIPNDEGVPEPPERVHWDSPFAKTIGAPAAYDYGPERIAWLGTLLTNWIGDEGVLQKLNVKLLRLNMVGDLTTCGGQVTGKVRADSESRVHLDIWTRDQRGEITAQGQAVVTLPSRQPQQPS